MGLFSDDNCWLLRRDKFREQNRFSVMSDWNYVLLSKMVSAQQSTIIIQKMPITNDITVFILGYRQDIGFSSLSISSTTEHSGLKGEAPEKKCLWQSVNGFFHQNIYWFWKALTQNLRVGSFWINPTKWCQKKLKNWILKG